MARVEQRKNSCQEGLTINPVSVRIAPMKEKPQGTRAGWRLPDWLLPVSKADLNQLLNKIMSAIETFGTAVNASFDKLGTAVDGVAADVDFLKAEIKKLQDNPGPISPADQAILDGIQARADQLDQKVEALDAMTSQPPVPPTP